MRKNYLRNLCGALLLPGTMAAAMFPCGKVHAQDVPVSIFTVAESLQAALSSITLGPHSYRNEFTNSVDVFAGYLAVSMSVSQGSGALPFTYSWPNDYYSSAGRIGPVEYLYDAYAYAGELGYPEYKAIAQIVYGMTALRSVNVKGAIPYVDGRNLEMWHPLSYQSQEETYNMILADLDEAIATLEQVQPDAATLRAIEGEGMQNGTATDAYSGYNWKKWVQLANTIKLRLAMCLAKPNPALAQQVATEALGGNGVLEEDFGGTWVQGTDIHPAYIISSTAGGWAECRMGASIENAMKRLGHPLIGVFFTTNSGQIKDRSFGVTLLAEGADYVGIRQGVTMEPKSPGAGYYNFSEVNTPVKFIRQTWVCKEEVLFLKAEAALRWGIGGSAQQNYEDGIRAVFTRYGASGVDEYLARTETVKDDNGNEIDYVDYYVNSNSCPGRIEVGVAWNDGDSDETKLEKIITQKWISMFPNGGYEAWTDFRRTGYPRLLPVPEENRWTGTPSFPVELQIRRIPNIYSVDYGFSLDNNLIGLDIYDGAQYIGITKKEGVSLNISNDSPDVAAAELICDEAGCKLKITPKGTGNAVIRVYSSSHSENLYVVVKDKLKFSANQVKMNVNGSSTIYLSVHGSLSQDKLETSLALLDGSGNDIMTQYAVNEIPSYSDSVKYEITFTAGSKAEELVFRAAAADRSIEIPVYVSYYTYLSFNTIDPADPGSNIGSISGINLKTNSSSYVRFYFYVEGDDAVRQEVTDAIADAANYTYEGSAPVVMGEPAVGPVGNGVYSAAFAVYAGDVVGDGTVTVNIFGEKLTVGVYIDDGERYDAVYISFTAPNTYTIPPTGMTYTASKTLFSDEPTFKIRVYHYVNPDVRAPYIDWNIEQSGDPVIMPTGRQVSSDYRYTDFEYLVSGEPGEAEIEFSVYNPQGELGGIYAEYLNQTITATVTVADRESFLVNSVTFEFDFDNIETNAATVPLVAVMDPAVSVAAWPITYTVTEGSDIAEIVGPIDESSDTYYQLNIKKAGTIKVKAQAGEGDKEKSDELTVVAKLRLDQVMISEGRSPLEITTAPSSLYVGEEGTVTKLLHANYTVDESEFTWRSSNPEVLSVDANGKVTALAEGKAAVIVEIRDDYNTYASDQREITVRTLSIDADISTLPSDYYVVYFAGDPVFFVDTEEGSADYYTFSLDREILTEDGIYTAGTDFNGTVTFPVSTGSTECEITGGTIQVSGGVATFNLTVSYEGATGTIAGSKELLGL